MEQPTEHARTRLPSRRSKAIFVCSEGGATEHTVKLMPTCMFDPGAMRYIDRTLLGADFWVI